MQVPSINRNLSICPFQILFENQTISTFVFNIYPLDHRRNTDIVNHKGAREFYDGVLKYLFKEASYGAIIGPFDKNPFPGHFKISPLNTVSKKDTLERIL
jgi:hypothetical protein